MIATPTRCLFGGALASLLLLPPAALGQDDGRAPLAPVALVEFGHRDSWTPNPCTPGPIQGLLPIQGSRGKSGISSWVRPY